MNESSDPIRVIPLSTTGGTTLNAVWKQREVYVVCRG